MKYVKWQLLKAGVKAHNLRRQGTGFASNLAQDQHGDGVVGVIIGILISLVLAILVLGGLYLLYNQTVMPDISGKFTAMNSYGG